MQLHLTVSVIISEALEHVHHLKNMVFIHVEKKRKQKISLLVTSISCSLLLAEKKKLYFYVILKPHHTFK